MYRIIKGLLLIGTIGFILVLASSCKKEQSIFAVADFSYSGRTDTVPTTIQFINKSFGISYMWDFGDGSGSTDKNPRHTFNQPGTYNVKLIAKGTNNTDTMEVGLGIGDIFPRNGLVGWWPFNGNANDESGNGNHGTVYGATLTTDRFGNQNGAYLSNSNSTNSITGSCSNFPSGNSPRTISIWYNASGLGSGCCKGLFGYGGGGCGRGLILNFENQDVGAGKFEIQGHCQAFRQVMNYPLPANNFWHNVLISYDANSILRFYFNGQLSYTSTPVSLNTNVNSKIFNLIGQVSPDGNSPYFDVNWTPFNGKLDDIGIWNRALTQQEITNLYNGRQ